jgi:S-DNA-T family DNA segregation ATPase FtsK/SpoIIIE
MSESVGNLGRAAFLPPGARDFLLRRLVELLGLALIGVALWLALALASFHGDDPAFDKATGQAVQNLMGGAGAWTSELLLQGLGVASALLPAVLLAWGWRLLRHRRLARFWVKAAVLPLALAALSIAATALPTPASWPALLANCGVGGCIGRQSVALLGHAAGWRGGLVSLGGLIAALLLLYAAAGIPWRAYRVAGGHAGRLSGRAGRGFAWLYGRLRRSAAAAAERRAQRVEAARQAPVLARAPELEADEPPPLEIPEPIAAPDEAPERIERPERPERPDRPERIDRAERIERNDPRISIPAPPEAREERLVAQRKPRAKPGKRAASADQPTLDLVPSEDYALPPLDLLAKPNPAAAQQARVSEESLEKNARLLESVLDDFGVKGEIVKVRPGPVVTLYELEPAPGTKTSRVVGLADDIARSMSALAVRVAVIPGRSVIGIELPNQQRETVLLRELLASADYERTSHRLSLVLGKDIGGTPIIVDLARMPHLLIAGTTGSGKSVAINTMILSLIYRLPPDTCKFIMVDPKMLELSVYDGIPHLLAPVVTDPRKAIVAVKWAVREMENRYRAMSKLGVRNIEGYNQRIAQARASGEVLTRKVQTGFDAETGAPIYEEEPFDLVELPFIVVVVDEMADLMLVAGKEIEAAIQRLAQMARAAGIHIIMATQRPSVDVITGTIKANFPTRISFHVTSRIDSRTILGETGAEQLLGQGDMLYMAQGGRITRVHGPFVGDAEVEKVVAYLKEQGEPTYVEEVTRDDEEMPSGGGGEDGGEGSDDLYDRAVALVCRERKASTSFVQRHLQIGYNRAARLIERMEKEGVVSAANHVGKREVLARDIDRPE